MAWSAEQSHRCPRCGTFDWEWQDPDTHEQVHTWEADVNTCQGCFGLDATAARMKAGKGTLHGQRPRLFYVKGGDAGGG